MRKIQTEKYENLKMEAASEIGIDLKNEDKIKDMTDYSTSIGGRMVKKMIEEMETE